MNRFIAGLATIQPFGVKIRHLAATAVLICASSPAAWAIILPQKAMNMRAAIRDVQYGDLVIFDQDNTVYRQAQMLGTHEWCDAYEEQLKVEGVPYELARKMKIDLLEAINNKTAVIPIEDVTPFLIANLQRQGVPVIGLTARYLVLAPATFRQLNFLNIQYSFRDKTLKLSPNALFEQGVLFTNDTDKGVALVQLLDALELKPKRIVMVDDRLFNLQHVEKAMTAYNKKCALAGKEGIEFIGIHYGGADKWVENFDAEIAAIELRAFRSSSRHGATRMVSDEAARAQFAARPLSSCQWRLSRGTAETAGAARSGLKH